MNTAPAHDDISIYVRIKWNAWMKIQHQSKIEHRDPRQQAAFVLEQYAERLRFPESAELVA